MNAKSDGPRAGDASLPDRVEAAAQALEQSRGYAVPGYWHEVAKTALAAADTCEAERNPNTTDEYEQVGWFCDGELLALDEKPTEHEQAAYYAATGRLPDDDGDYEPVYARRPVSSEDVHREAAE